MLESEERPYKNYEAFEKDKIQCKACEIGSIYNKVVLSDGCKKNPVVIAIGEAPGRDEIEKGKPFVGKAGKLLRSTLNTFGFRSTNTLISNVIPCRPQNNKFPQNSKLVNECFRRWLVEEIKLTTPKYLLLFGNQPLRYVLGMSGITKCRGNFVEFSLDESSIIQVMPTFHPSYVLRKEYMEDGELIKSQFNMDIQAVAIKAGFLS